MVGLHRKWSSWEWGGTPVPLFLPLPPAREHGGYWPLAVGWENTSFVQYSQEVEPNPVGISPQSGSTTLPSTGSWVEGPRVPQLICQAKPRKRLSWQPLRDDGTAMLSGRHNVASVPEANTRVRL